MLQRISMKQGTTPNDLCHALKAVAERAGSRLVARPYNPYEADRTTWWLVPSTDFPAHRFGKYSVRWFEPAQATILAGLEVEKGVGPAAAPAFRSAKGRRLVMNADWEWFRFIEDIRSGDFLDALDTAAGRIEAEVLVRISLGMIDDPDVFDPDTPKLPRSYWTFVWRPSGRSLTWRQSDGMTQLAPQMQAAKTLPDVLHEIEMAENSDWLWAKIVACVALNVRATAGDVAPITEQQLWSRFLSPLLPWVRAA